MLETLMTREEIKKATEEFLASGGKIKKIKIKKEVTGPPVSAYEYNQLCFDPKIALKDI